MPYPEAAAQSFNGIKSVVPTLSLDDERAIDEKSVIFFLTRRYRRTTWGITMAATELRHDADPKSNRQFKGTIPMPARKPGPPPKPTTRSNRVGSSTWHGRSKRTKRRARWIGLLRRLSETQVQRCHPSGATLIVMTSRASFGSPLTGSKRRSASTDARVETGVVLQQTIEWRLSVIRLRVSPTCDASRGIERASNKVLSRLSISAGVKTSPGLPARR